jgi:hypothetical protein
MRSSHSAERWGRSDSGVPESPVFLPAARAKKRAQIPARFVIFNISIEKN